MTKANSPLSDHDLCAKSICDHLEMKERGGKKAMWDVMRDDYKAWACGGRELDEEDEDAFNEYRRPQIVPDGWAYGTKDELSDKMVSIICSSGKGMFDQFPDGVKWLVLLEVTNYNGMAGKMENYENYFWEWDGISHPTFYVLEYDMNTRNLTVFWATDFVRYSPTSVDHAAVAVESMEKITYAS